MADLRPGEARLIPHDGQEVALFNVEGRYYAVGNRCPHRGGPLVRGRVERMPSGAAAVRCPIHGWLFELATGRCVNQPDAGIPTYTAECQDGQLRVRPRGEGVP